MSNELSVQSAFHLLQKKDPSEQDYFSLRQLLASEILPTEEQLAHFNRINASDALEAAWGGFLKFAEGLLQNSLLLADVAERGEREAEGEAAQLNFSEDAASRFQVVKPILEKVQTLWESGLHDLEAELGPLVHKDDLSVIVAYLRRVHARSSLGAEWGLTLSEDTLSTLNSTNREKLSKRIKKFNEAAESSEKARSYISKEKSNYNTNLDILSGAQMQAIECLHEDSRDRALSHARRMTPIRKQIEGRGAVAKPKPKPDVSGLLDTLVRVSVTDSLGSTSGSAPATPRASFRSNGTSFADPQPLPLSNEKDFQKIPLELRQKIIDSLQQPLDPNTQDEKGNSLLYYAVRSRSKEFAKILLEFGATVFSVNSRGETVLDLHDGWFQKEFPEAVNVSQLKEKLVSERKSLNALKARSEAAHAKFKSVLEYLSRQANDIRFKSEPARKKIAVIYKVMEDLSSGGQSARAILNALISDPTIQEKRGFIGGFKRPKTLVLLESIKLVLEESITRLESQSQDSGAQQLNLLNSEDNPADLVRKLAILKAQSEREKQCLNRLRLVEELLGSVIEYIKDEQRSYLYTFSPDYLLLEERLTLIEAAKSDVVYRGASVGEKIETLLENKRINTKRGLFSFWGQQTQTAKLLAEAKGRLEQEGERDKFSCLRAKAG